MKKFFLKREIYYDFVCIKNIIKYIFNPHKYLLLKASVKYSNGHVEKFNWGDDVSFVLISLISKKTALYYPETRISKRLPIRTYMTIGSIVSYFSMNHTVVWGSGLINEKESCRINSIPEKVCAVRGPYTRSVFLKHGIDCPDIYGDPALLFPTFYTPNAIKDGKIGIIPHYIDIDKQCIKETLQKNTVKVIDVQGYETWQQFIDEICACEYIISSSLHGLIVSEAYKIPAVWVEFGNYTDGWEFKFLDFYESIGKYNEEPLVMGDHLDFNIISRKVSKWKPGTWDSELLLSTCPFYERDESDVK